MIADSVATTLFYGPNLLLLHSLTMRSYKSLQQTQRIPVPYGGGCLKVSTLFFRLRVIWGCYAQISLVPSCLLSRLYASGLTLIESSSRVFGLILASIAITSMIVAIKLSFGLA